MRFQRKLRKQSLAEAYADYHGIFSQPRQKTIVVPASAAQARAIGGKRDAGNEHQIEILRTHFCFCIRSWFAQSPSGRKQIVDRPRAMEREAFIIDPASVYPRKTKLARIVTKPKRFE